MHVNGGTPPYIFNLNAGPWQWDSLFTNLTAGNYYCTYNDGAGCEDTILIIIDSEVSLISIPGEELNIYPNPGGGEITIELGGYFDNLRFNITDFSGRIVYKGTASGVEFIKFNPNLAQGIYFLNVVREGQPVQRIKLERNSE